MGMDGNGGLGWLWRYSHYMVVMDWIIPPFPTFSTSMTMVSTRGEIWKNMWLWVKTLAPKLGHPRYPKISLIKWCLFPEHIQNMVIIPRTYPKYGNNRFWPITMSSAKSGLWCMKHHERESLNTRPSHIAMPLPKSFTLLWQLSWPLAINIINSFALTVCYLRVSQSWEPQNIDLSSCSILFHRFSIDFPH